MSRLLSAKSLEKVALDLHVGSLAVIEGPAGSGKTRALIGRVVRLLADGAAGKDILVICATSIAAADLRERLVKTATGQPGQAEQVKVTTAPLLAKDLLVAASDEKRILLPFELPLLLDDLERIGTRRNRIEAILSFFERSWSELADWNPAWLITHEELDISRIVGEWQQEKGVRLASRLVPDAMTLLHANKEASDTPMAPQYRYVFVDDYELLTRAEQALCTALCRDSLYVVAGFEKTSGIRNAHPYGEGLAELLNQNPQATKTTLAAAASDKEQTSETGSVLTAEEIKTFTSPAEEFNAAASQVASWIGGGIAPEDIVIIAAHPTWRANLKKAVDNALTDSSNATGTAGKAVAEVIPDGTTSEHWGAARRRAVSLLRLVANPRDTVAITMLEGRATYDALADLGGSALLDAIAHAVLPEAGAARQRNALAFFLREYCRPCEDEPATKLVAKLAASLFDPAPAAPKALRILSPRLAWGLEPQACLIAGCMEGFLPSSTVFEKTTVPGNIRERELTIDTNAIRNIKYNSKIFVSMASQEIPVQVADRLGLEPRKIVLREGRRTALLSPSKL